MKNSRFVIIGLFFILQFSNYSFGQDCYGLSRKKATRMAKTTFISWFNENKTLHGYKRIVSVEDVVIWLETDIDCSVYIRPSDFNKLPKYKQDSISLKMCRDCYFMDVYVINENDNRIGLNLSFDIFLNLICVFEERVGNGKGKILYEFE